MLKRLSYLLIFISISLFAHSSEDLFDSVIALKLYKPTGMHDCSATTITPYYLITAAHCVQSTYKFEYATGSSKRNYEHLEIDEIHTPKNWDPQNRTYDIAIIKLKKPVPSPKHPVVLSYELEQDLDFENLDITTVGYGSIIGKPKRKNKKILSKHYIMHFNEQIRMLAPGDKPKEDICFGDSGGGSFVVVEGQVVFVASTVGILGDSNDNSLSACGKMKLTLHEDIRFHKDWIESVLNRI